ncbi:CBS domain-containing protein [Magnetospira thiophila]
MTIRIADVIKGHELVQVDGHATVREAGRAMNDKNVGAVVVVEEGKLLGIFTERDALRIFVATRRNADMTEVRDVMTRDPKCVTPETLTSEALHIMDAGGYRHLPVMDGDKLVGVVSRRALANSADGDTGS